MGITFLMLSWICLFVTDRFFITPKPIRLLFFCLGLLTSIWAFWKSLIYGFYFATNWKWLAKRVRKKFRGKGERLLGIIEISREENGKGNNFSTQIFEAAQHKMVQDIKTIEPQEIFPWKILNKVALNTCGCLLITFSFFLIFPQLSLNSLHRWVFPVESIERATLTQLVNTHNDSFFLLKNEVNDVRFAVSNKSKLNPETLHLVKGGENPFHLVSIKNGGIYEFQIPPQSETFLAELEGGDFKRNFLFNPISRPAIESITATLNFPNYMGLEKQETQILNRKVKVPEKTSISINGKINRSLGQVAIAETKATFASSSPTNSFSLDLGTLNHNRSFSLYLSDEYGFSPLEETKLIIETEKDNPPSIVFSNNNDLSPILLFETRKLQIDVNDDYGLSECFFKMKVFDQQKEILNETLYGQDFKRGGTKELKIEFPFDPLIYDLKDGQEVVFFATANDHYPKRTGSVSESYRFLIIGKEKHAEMIRSKLESLIADVSEIARKQQSIQYETLSQEQENILQQNPNLNAKQKSQLEQLAGNQKDLAKALDKTANKGLNILDSASMNPVLEPQMLSNFANSFKNMKNTASDPMDAASGKILDASSSNVQQSSKRMTEAADLQEEALENLREILAQFTEQIDQFEALTLGQRLSQLGNTEKKLAKKLISIMPSSIGRTPTQLKGIHRRANDDMETTQNEVTSDSLDVQGEISRYYERTGKIEYARVSQLMENAKTTKALSRVARNLKNNISFKALDELTFWEANFVNWAKLLQQESPGGDSPGAQGGEGKDRTKDILSLLKIRNSQNEIFLKTKTIQSKGFIGKKDKWSRSLKHQQDTLMIDLTDTQISVAEETLNPIFDDAHMAMSESSARLSDKVTDQKTQTFQKEAKNCVSDLINLLLEGQGQGQSKAQNENLTVMQLLLMQMENKNSGNTKGKSPTGGKVGGGSEQGGTTSEVSDSLQGTSSNQNSSSSSTDQNSGLSNPVVAPEFQTIMDLYYEALEE